jgi:hypothetical protein
MPTVIAINTQNHRKNPTNSHRSRRVRGTMRKRVGFNKIPAEHNAMTGRSKLTTEGKLGEWYRKCRLNIIHAAAGKMGKSHNIVLRIAIVLRG